MVSRKGACQCESILGEDNDIVVFVDAMGGALIVCVA